MVVVLVADHAPVAQVTLSVFVQLGQLPLAHAKAADDFVMDPGG